MLASIAIVAALLVGVANAAPCDIYAAGGTPCVAAHSPVRSLYNAYTGPLYQVQRLSDNKTQDIHPLSAGGIANAATQDAFCPKNDCMFSIIYDQSGHGNDLTVCQGGGWVTYPDDPVNATQHPITVGGHKAYGMWFTFGMGYRNGKGNGVAKGDEAEAIYMVTSGIHAGGGCCFDYGNAETSGRDDGKASMEALNVANWGGMGVSIGVDMEQSTYSGDCWGDSCGVPSLAGVPYITAMVKGRSGGTMAIKQADSQQSKLYTKYDGPRPDGFKVMKKQGAIILGIGGDNSNSGEGCFYEGVLVKGDPSSSTDDQVQADIAAAGYITPVTLPPPPIKYPKLHEQCGGKIYGGPTKCVDGLECVYVSEWKSECRKSTRPTTKPVTTKPVTTKPATTKPVTTAPVTTVPATTQPATTAPVTTAPATTQPSTTTPGTTAPVTTQPATTAPAPATTQPATTAPASTQPTTTAPTSTQPDTTAPATSVPVTTKPVTTAPATTVPATTKPVTTTPKPWTTMPERKVPFWGQCGGLGYHGPTKCAQGYCKELNLWNSWCVYIPPVDPTKVPLWGQCGGKGYFGPTKCTEGYCKKLNDFGSWCVILPPQNPNQNQQKPPNQQN